MGLGFHGLVGINGQSVIDVNTKQLMFATISAQHESEHEPKRTEHRLALEIM
jgi:hypothetical protein